MVTALSSKKEGDAATAMGRILPKGMAIASLGTRSALRTPRSKPVATTSLEFADRIADGGSRHAEIKRRRSKRATPNDGDNCLKFD